MIKTRLIYNPRAGAKFPRFMRNPRLRLNDLYALLDKFEIEFESAPTSAPGDAARLAHEAAESGYRLVIAAGGDGTVGEAANGLVGTGVPLGIIPLGTYMNIARMLSIPADLEKAAMIIKIGKTRLIDAGKILYMNADGAEDNPGENQWHFFESAGAGLDAEFHKQYIRLREGEWSAAWAMAKSLFRSYRIPLKVELDEGRTIITESRAVIVSNGPYMGANIPIAETAKLNDRLLTVRIYRMSKPRLLVHVLRLKTLGPDSDPDAQTFTTKTVRISSSEKRPVHADARVFGETPVSIAVLPEALKVIAGFARPSPDNALLEKARGGPYVY